MRKPRATARWPRPATRLGGAALVAAVGWASLGGQALAGQDSPPVPGPTPELSLPPGQEAALANGARVLLVPGDEVPMASVTLVIPSGTATDPAGKEGLAGMVARLLGAGTPERAGADLSGKLASLGASLSASTAPDFLRIDFRGPAVELEAGLDLMAGAVIAPAFPAEALEAAREQALPSLRNQAGQPSLLAEGYFLAEVYGNHPYGRQVSQASLRGISRDDLVAWYGAHVRPQGAFFMVTGNVTLDRVTAALEASFSAWRPGSPPPQSSAGAVNRASPEVVLIDRPGAAIAHVRLGHLLPAGSDPDWPALRMGVRVLGGGPDSRLDQTLRAEMALTTDAFATVERRRARGYFQAGFSARNSLVVRTLELMWAETERIRDQLVPAEELDRIRARVMGEQILALETPEQVGALLARDRVLGLDGPVGGGFRSRVAELTPEGLRRAVRSHIRPREVVIVVVGDAGQLREQLETFGPVRVLNVRGVVAEGPGAIPVQASEDFSGVGLEPVTARYQIYFQGREAGTSTRTLELLSDSLLRFGTRASLGPQEVNQSVTVRARDLAFVSSDIQLRSMGQELTGSLRREGDRIAGTLRSPMGDTEVDVAARDDVLVSDMLELAIWVADLEVGKVITVPVLNVQSGEVETVRLRVVDRTDDVSVAGRPLPEVFVVEVDASDPQTLFARVEVPHVVLLLQPASQPVDVVLTSLIPGVSGSEGGTGYDPEVPGAEAPGPGAGGG